MAADLDLDLLRTFAAIAESGGFTRAAARVGRTQSAVSLQIRRLERQAGTALFRREGRAMVLTEAGETLLGFARRILRLNDQALAALSQTAVVGPMRFGMVPDFAEASLPAVLGGFARRHPGVRLEVRVADGGDLLGDLVRGTLDLVLAGSSGGAPPPIRREPMRWIGAEGYTPRSPVPLVVLEPPCAFRAAALAALAAAGIDHRIVYTAPGLAGLKAAVHAGLGLTPRTAGLLEPGLRVLGAGDGLPALPEVGFALYGGEGASPAARRLADEVVAALAAPAR